MSARSRLMTPNTTPKTSQGIADLPQNTRLTTPLSPLMTGARKCSGGGGDGGPAIWKMPATTTASHADAIARRANAMAYRASANARLTKPTIASTLRAESNCSKVLAMKTLNARKPPKHPVKEAGDQKSGVIKISLNGLKQPLRLFSPRKAAGGVPQPTECQNDTEEEPPAVQMLEKAIQTKEKELLNYKLIVGDIKLLMPSKHIVEEILRARLERKKEMERPVQRKFAPHELDEEQHLDELKEFAERNYVTRRVPKKPASIQYPLPDTNHFRNTFSSMDEFFSRAIPKAESVTKIKERIRRKEEELMSMFDDVDMSEKSEFEGE